MANNELTTAERPVSRPKEEVIREAKRLEESALYSSKGHFAAANFWTKFHLWLGVPIVIGSGLAGAAAFSQFDDSGTWAGIISVVVVMLSSVATFLNANEKASTHLNSGNHYDALMSAVRRFWSIECWCSDSDSGLLEKLENLSDRRDKLNQSCPQIPKWAYLIAKRGIQAGEAQHSVDKN